LIASLGQLTLLLERVHVRKYASKDGSNIPRKKYDKVHVRIIFVSQYP
jgi:hypothetical protein